MGGRGKYAGTEWREQKSRVGQRVLEFSKGGLKEGEKAWIAAHQYALSDNAEVNGGSCAWKKRQAAARAVLASG